MESDDFKRKAKEAASNVRKKNAKEKQYDPVADRPEQDVPWSEEAVNFLQEFHESEGRGVLYFSRCGFPRQGLAIRKRERERRNAQGR